MSHLLGVAAAGAAALLIACGGGAGGLSAGMLATEPFPTWSDEFDGAAEAPPDPSVWATRTGGRWMNGGTPELQSFQYGRIEARIKLPTGSGAWPAWWMVGATGSWPASGEIEVLEHRPGPEPDEGYHGVVGNTSDGTFWAQRTAVTDVGGGGWHTYGIDWRPGRIAFLVDGATTWTRTPADVPESARWPFDEAFGLLLNVAVGNWAGVPDPAQFPAQMLVDWVRVYEPPDPTVAVAGDVAASNGGSARTAAILAGLGMDAVLMAGDGAYPDGSAADYATYYDPTWGPFKPITHPVPGNHDYHVPDAAGYFEYFGALAGEPGKGWYSFDLGAWHVIALNSSGGCSPVPCRVGSEQYPWLEADLAAHPNRCTLAYWHHPRWSMGRYGPGSESVAPLWKALYDAGADLVFSGHDHSYQRFMPLDEAGPRIPTVASARSSWEPAATPHMRWALPAGRSRRLSRGRSACLR
jgi:hypothetical protein